MKQWKQWKQKIVELSGKLTPRRTAALIAVIAVLLAVLIAIVSFGGGGSVELPQGEGSAQQPEVEQPSGYTQTDADITVDNVQSVISSLSRPESYSAHITNTVYWNGAWKGVEADRYVLKGTSLTKYYDTKGEEERYTVLRGGQYFSWRTGDTDYYMGSSGELSADSASMLPTYEDVAKLTAESITEAGMRELNGSPCIYVTTEERDSGYTLTYWISPVNGLLVQADYRKKDQLVRSVVVSDVQSEAPDEALFELPDGQSALTATKKMTSSKTSQSDSKSTKNKKKS